MALLVVGGDMREFLRVVLVLSSVSCGSRQAPPIPVPTPEIEIQVEQALIADADLLLVGISIGTTLPDGVVVDSVDAAATLQGVDLGELELVPMMEARMPPWTLMLMWQIPSDSTFIVDGDSSITGTVAWRSASPTVRYTSFTRALDLESTQDDVPSTELDSLEESGSTTLEASEANP